MAHKAKRAEQLERFGWVPVFPCSDNLPPLRRLKENTDIHIAGVIAPDWAVSDLVSRHAGH